MIITVKTKNHTGYLDKEERYHEDCSYKNFIKNLLNNWRININYLKNIVSLFFGKMNNYDY